MAEKSFKEKAREEILTVLPDEGHCIFAFLSAVAKISGSIEIVKRRTNLCLQLDGYEEAAAIVGLLKTAYPSDFEIFAGHAKATAKKSGDFVGVQVPAGFTKQVLTDLCLMRADSERYISFSCGVPWELMQNVCCRKNYLKGLFLACGSVYVPSMNDEGEKKEGYHFEFQLDDEQTASGVIDLLTSFDIHAKTSERGSHLLVYLKDKDEILDFLGLLSLAESAMKLRAIIDERETANSINRATICETANLDKTFAAASKQLLSIGIIEDRDGLESLAPSLLETARARMEYPQASLSELADILGVSKSCLNHRLRKINELAEEN